MKFYLGNTKASKLSTEMVYEIRQRWANRFFVRVTMRQMAFEYEVSPNTISNIVNGLSHRAVAMVESAGDAEYRQKLMNDQLKRALEREPEAIDPKVEEAFEDMKLTNPPPNSVPTLEEHAATVARMAAKLKTQQVETKEETRNDGEVQSDGGVDRGEDSGSGGGSGG